MDNCPKCNRQVEDSQALFCGSCGADLSRSVTNSSNNDDDLDFVVTESAGVDPEFVGGSREFDKNEQESSKLEQNDDSESLHSDPVGSAAAPDYEQESDNSPIGQSSPFLPGQADSPEESPTTNNISSDNDESALSGSQQIKKLSEDEIKSINEGLYGKLNKDEKSELVEKLKATTSAAKPEPLLQKLAPKPELDIETDKSDLSSPKMAEKSKGVAYFFKKYIEVPSAQEIYAGDEIEFHDRSYELVPKQFNTTGYKITAASIFGLFLLFIGSLFVGDPSGHGQIVGIVYDLDGVPYTEGATVVLPDEQVRTTSNGEGFFVVSDLPAGPHKLDCFVDNKLVMSDVLTVSDGKTSTVAFMPSIEEVGQVATTKITQPIDLKPVKAETVDSEPETILAEKKSEVNKTNTSSNTKTKTKAIVKKNSPGKVVLAANVDGAKLSIDGNVMGAGNLTYSKIKTGLHQYKVTSDGYKTAEGSFNLKSGEKKVLTVALMPLSADEKIAQMSAEELYYSGINAYKTGNITSAISDLSASISKEPGNPTAHYYRGEAYNSIGEKEKAHSDYIRSAEQFRFSKKYADAISAYGKAADIAPDDITAYLGRGQLYLDKKSAIAALADFEYAIEIDKNNFQAQYGLGRARFDQGNYKKAIDHFKKARSIDSKNALTYQYLMLSYFARDKVNDVKKSYIKFEEVASAKDKNQFQTDKKFAAVRAVISID